MRELKFRAWNVEGKEMIQNIQDEYEEPFSVWWRGASKCEVMQYIGLQDKNGKDIYEGDIIKEVYPGGKIENFYKVDYDFIRSCGCCATVYRWEIEFDPSCSEVVGNIYENPELILKVRS